MAIYTGVKVDTTGVYKIGSSPDSALSEPMVDNIYTGVVVSGVSPDMLKLASSNSDAISDPIESYTAVKSPSLVFIPSGG